MSADLSIEKIKEKMKDSDLSEDDMLKVLKKAYKLQQERRIKRNTMEDDFRKASARNLPCPVCEVKLKKCKCGFAEKLKI